MQGSRGILDAAFGISQGEVLGIGGVWNCGRLSFWDELSGTREAGLLSELFPCVIPLLATMSFSCTL